MKKLLFTLLVLGLAVSASATVSYEIRADDGVTVINGYLMLGTDYMVFIKGVNTDAPLDGMTVGPTLSMDDWTVASLSNPVVIDTGNLSNNEYDPESGGYIWGVGDAYGPGVSTGDWFSWDLTILKIGAFQLDFWNSKVSETQPDVSMVMNLLIPEPVTVALLGLGGLFIRRRK